MDEKINKLIQEHFKLKEEISKLTERDDIIKEELKFCLNEKGINSYEDNDGNLVKYNQQSRESIDKKKVKSLLSESDFAGVLKVTTFDTMRIISKTQRENFRSKEEK